VIELIPLQSEGNGFLWLVLMLITAYWIYKIETGGSSSGDSRTQRNPPRSRNPAPQKTDPSSAKRTSANNPPEPEPDPEPESEPIDDDRDIGVDRESYTDRLERPEFDFDDAESRTASDGSDNPPELPETDDLLDQLGLDDLSEDQ